MHLIESMAYRGQVPWHSLGNFIDGEVTPEGMKKAAKLDWPVLPLQFYFKDPSGRIDKRTGQVLEHFVPDFRVLVRGSDLKYLDTISRVYKPVQNEEIFEVFIKFTEAGHMKMETAGSLDGGRMVWALARLENASFTLGSDDTNDMYLLLSTGHKVGFAYQADLTSIRVVCANTLRLARSRNAKADTRWKMSHSSEWNDTRKKELQQLIENAMDYSKIYEAQARQLLGHKVSRKETEAFVIELIQPKLLDKIVEETLKMKIPATMKVSEFRAKNGKDVLNAIMSREERLWSDSDLMTPTRKVLAAVDNQPQSDVSRGTMWGVFNGYTYYTDHLAGNKQDTRLQNAWYGPTSAKKNDALQLAIEYTQRLAA